MIEIKTYNKQSAINKKQIQDYKNKFLNFINDDLNSPKALALMWEVIKDKKLKMQNKQELLLDFDKVLGLDLAKVKKTGDPSRILSLAKQRENYRKAGQWK